MIPRYGRSHVVASHIPTGIVVMCDTERSQHRNKAICITRIKSLIHVGYVPNNVPKEQPVFEYKLPDENLYPDDLTPFKELPCKRMDILAGTS